MKYNRLLIMNFYNNEQYNYDVFNKTDEKVKPFINRVFESFIEDGDMINRCDDCLVMCEDGGDYNICPECGKQSEKDIYSENTVLSQIYNVGNSDNYNSTNYNELSKKNVINLLRKYTYENNIINDDVLLYAAEEFCKIRQYKTYRNTMRMSILLMLIYRRYQELEKDISKSELMKIYKLTDKKKISKADTILRCYNEIDIINVKFNSNERNIIKKIVYDLGLKADRTDIDNIMNIVDNVNKNYIYILKTPKIKTVCIIVIYLYMCAKYEKFNRRDFKNNCGISKTTFIQHRNILIEYKKFYSEQLAIYNLKYPKIL